MNCFECAKVNDTVAAVGVCRHCGVGLCLDHLIEAHGVHGRRHPLRLPARHPATKPLRGVPAGIAAAARHHTAGSVS